MSEDFFVVLPSNASADVFPDNKINNFTTKLAKDLKLANYEVALTEIQYPCTWWDVPWDAYFSYGYFTSNQTKAHVPRGYYKSIPDLVNHINQHVVPSDQHGPWFDLSYDEVSAKVTLKIQRDRGQLSISESLAQILGFHSLRWFVFIGGQTDDSWTGDAQADLTRGMSALYVYSNVVQPRLVGDTSVRLLRCIPIKDKEKGENKCIEFLHPTYLPTSKDTTDLISVVIRRDNGELVPFKAGKVVVTLHFKKAK